MKFIKFDIKNFKGIKEATVNLEGGRIFTLVGLNEGGKTTLLEAIHSLSPDVDTELVVGNVPTLDEQKKQWVPKDKVGHFNDDIVVSASLEFEKDDIDNFMRRARIIGLDVDRTCLENGFILTRTTKYKDGDFKSKTYLNNIVYRVKSGRQQNYRIAKPEEKVALGNILHSILPRIAYFPSFVFDFPNKIYLTDGNGKGDKANTYYKKLFQDILDYGGNGLKIGTNIVDRIHTPDAKLPWADFNTWLNNSDVESKIDSITAKASQTITRVVFDTWKKIFNEDRGGSRIFVNWKVEEGNTDEDENGNEIPATEHDLYVTIELTQGTQKFEIKDRSLGFRWFFTFLLFTQFRVARASGRPIIFLFDEPASNLHASAQEKLVESFSKISKAPHIFIYTTHSHYMIEPKWLEQTYIVQNGEIDENGKLLSSATREDSETDIKVIKYRNFVNSNPSKTSVGYFQPIMDRLNVAPSKFDYDKRGVILEGKSDYFIFRYLSDVHFNKNINFFPGVGATTLDPLISLQKGWGLPVLVLLDSDKAGAAAKQDYIDKYFLQDNEIVCLGDLVDGLTEIESLLERQDRDMIKEALSVNHNLNKKDICRFFQENLATGDKIELSNEMTEKAKELLEAIEKLIKEQIQD